MNIDASTTKEELAAIVAEQLRSDGIEAVLVGGAVVEIYSNGKYVTNDLDFVAWQSLDRIRAALGEDDRWLSDHKGKELPEHYSSDCNLKVTAKPMRAECALRECGPHCDVIRRMETHEWDGTGWQLKKTERKHFGDTGECGCCLDVP